MHNAKVRAIGVTTAPEVFNDIIHQYMDMGEDGGEMYEMTEKGKLQVSSLVLIPPPTWNISTRILGRRTAPFPPFLIPNCVPHGVTPRS